MHTEITEIMLLMALIISECRFFGFFALADMLLA